MNIYRISQTENDDYDTYDSAVVAAPDEEIARNTFPGDNICPPGGPDLLHTLSTWVMPDKVCVELIGTACPGMKAGVLCASFNAG